MKFSIVHRIACEPHTSALIRTEPRSSVRGIRLKKLYELLLLLRILLTINIQTGWISSEEFLGLEEITGKWFDLQVFQSSAFNSTFPTRSIVFPHLTIYIPYILTHHWLSYAHPTIPGESIPNPETLLVLPRLISVFLSFGVDLILLRFFALQQRHRQRVRNSQPEGQGDRDTESADLDIVYGQHSRLVALASSQVMLVLASRTHGAVVNTILFGLLLCFVSDAMHTMDEYLPILNDFHGIELTSRKEKEGHVKNSRRATVKKFQKQETHGMKRSKIDVPSSREKREDHAKISRNDLRSLHAAEHMRKVREKVGFLKELKSFNYNPIQHLHWIALIVVSGIFNDPDFFLSYGAVPIFFYLQRGISNGNVGMKEFHLRLVIFFLYFFLFSVPFILWDSFYHGRVTLQDFNDLTLTSSSFVVTPVNYFVTKSSSLRKFETVPWIFSNFLFIFNTLGLFGLISIAKEIYSALFQPWKCKPSLSSQWTFLNCSWFIPLVLLVQYKSPFDLAPLLIPLVILHGHKIPLVSKFSWKLGFSYFFFNLLGICFYGYMNQAGIVSSFLELSGQLVPHRFTDTHVDILVSQMVTIPPIFLLTIPSTWKTLLTPKPPLNETEPDSKTVLRLDPKKLRVFHTGLTPLPFCHLEPDLLRIFESKLKATMPPKLNLILLPSSYGQNTSCFRRSKVTLVKTYWNHWDLKWPYFDHSTNSTLQNLVPDGSLSLGLDLYRFEGTDSRYGYRNESEFREKFSFTKNPLSTTIIQCTLFAFTGFLFLMSFVTYVT